LIPKQEILLTGRPDPEEALDNFIRERAKEAESQQKRFITLMKDICSKNGDFLFKAGVKVKKSNMESPPQSQGKKAQRYFWKGLNLVKTECLRYWRVFNY
jgi:hypothetical protein